MDTQGFRFKTKVYKMVRAGIHCTPRNGRIQIEITIFLK
jgi:hypothetical protein